MNEQIVKISQAFLAQSSLELVAVICAILYVVLVIKENSWCWFFAFVSTALFIYLFHQVSLLSESLLNIYYLVMAVYGWWQWSSTKAMKTLRIQRWSMKRHSLIVVGCLLLTPLLGYFTASLGASFPYIDALVALLSVVATYMVTKKVFENWYYWLFIDSVSIYLFWQKQLYFVAALYVGYLVLVFIGIKAWKKTMQHV